MSLVLLLVVV